jgi:hypothetical protein
MMTVYVLAYLTVAVITMAADAEYSALAGIRYRLARSAAWALVWPVSSVLAICRGLRAQASATAAEERAARWREISLYLDRVGEAIRRER